MTNTAEVTVDDQSEDDLIEMEISEDDEATPITISSLFDILENFDVYGEKQQATINIWLPSAHLRCAAHTLALLATCDIENILNSTEYISSSIQRDFKKAFSKATNIMKSASASTKASDLTEATIGRQLPKPCTTRWNSSFDCLRILLNINKKLLNDLCIKLLIPQLDDEDYEILLEYVSIMKPISIYLDLLQGETNCFLGFVLPSIMKIKTELEAMELTKLGPLRDGILTKLDDRFVTDICFNKLVYLIILNNI